MSKNSTPEISQSVNVCPCGSEKKLVNCCLPAIEGKQPAVTAEDLLRSRYTAFTLGEVDYILKTHHSKTRSQIKPEEVEDWSKNSKWLGLKIGQMEQGKAEDSQGTIIFSATYSSTDKTGKAETHEHVEKSFFEKENGAWKFLDGQGVHQGTYQRSEPKTGRNDPCPCGSGKKFKKCHG